MTTSRRKTMRAAGRNAVNRASGASADVPGSASARRALGLLLAFTTERHTLTARELALITGIPLPSVYRYVAILRDSGLLVSAEQGTYHLSAHFVSLANAAQAADSLITIADPVMRNLAYSTGETILLVRLIDETAVCVHRIESSHRLRISFAQGQPMSLERGASARILLASMPEDRRRRTVEAFSPTAKAAAEYLANIERAGEQGWATSEQEIDPGIWASAAAIRSDGRIIAAISIPSPSVRAPEEMRSSRVLQVVDAAREIGQRIEASKS